MITKTNNNKEKKPMTDTLNYPVECTMQYGLFNNCFDGTDT